MRTLCASERLSTLDSLTRKRESGVDLNRLEGYRKRAGTSGRESFFDRPKRDKNLGTAQALMQSPAAVPCLDRNAYYLRRRNAPNANKPPPSRVKVPGSGTLLTPPRSWKDSEPVQRPWHEFP